MPDTTLLDGDVVVNAVRYPLASDVSRDRPGLAWWRNEYDPQREGQLNQLVRASWPHGWPGGIGESIRENRNSDGVGFSYNWDTSSYGVARPRSRRMFRALNSALLDPDKPAYRFERASPASADTDFFLYFGCQRYLFKVAVSKTEGGNVQAVVQEKDFGAGAAFGQATEFETEVQVPLGETVVFQSLTTVQPRLRQAWYYDGATYADDTAALEVPFGSAVTLLSAAASFHYWGCNATWTRLGVDIVTAGAGATVSYQYWNGAWAALTVTDGTTNFTVDGEIFWTAPGDWVSTTVNGVAGFYIRAVPSGVFGTAPTAAWAAPADTFTAAGAGVFATHFATIQDGSTAKIARSYSTNLVALAATAPRVAGNWGAGAEVGDTSTVITGLAESGVNLYTAKEKNLYVFSSTGASYPVFPNLQGVGDSINGRGVVAVPGTDICIYNHTSGIWRVAAGMLERIDVEAVRSLPSEIDSISSVGLPFRGRYRDLAVCGQWLYALLESPDANGAPFTYLMCAKLAERMIWFSIAVVGTGATFRATGLGWDSRYNLWLLNNDGGTVTSAIYGFQLAPDGAPPPRAGFGGLYGDVSTTYTLALPEDDFGYPWTIKQMLRFLVYGDNFSADAPLQCQIARDAGGTENVGATITDGSRTVTARYWTAGTNDTGYRTRPTLNLVTTANYVPSATADPRLLAVEVEAILRPDLAERVQFIVDTSRDYSNGALPLYPPAQMRANFHALAEGVASVTATDPRGTALVLNIVRVVDLLIWYDAMGEAQYLLEVTAQERIAA